MDNNNPLCLERAEPWDPAEPNPFALPGSPSPLQVELPWALFSSVPWILLLVETVIGLILYGLAMCFAVTIFLAFVGLVLLYAGLWIAIPINVLGLFLGLMGLVAGSGSRVARGSGIMALLVHGLILGTVLITLLRIHQP